MHAPSIRTRRLAAMAAGPIALLVAGVLVWQGSNAAFTAQTRNVGNNWATGSVTLTDDDSGAAAFAVANVVPGQTGTKCIAVTSNSSVPGVVKLYLQRVGLNGLENNIVGTMQSGTGGGFGSCTGFVADAPAAPAASFAAIETASNSYATGALPWTTLGISTGETKTYKLTWTFDVTGLSQTQIDALQGKSISTDIVWELQNS